MFSCTRANPKVGKGGGWGGRSCLSPYRKWKYKTLKRAPLPDPCINTTHVQGETRTHDRPPQDTYIRASSRLQCLPHTASKRYHPPGGRPTLSSKSTQKNQSKKAAAIFNTPVCSQTKICVQRPHDVPVLHTDTNSDPGTAETTENHAIQNTNK